MAGLENRSLARIAYILRTLRIHEEASGTLLTDVRKPLEDASKNLKTSR